MIKPSVTSYSRAVGIFLILSLVGGGLGEAYFPSLFMAGDAAATAAQLRLHGDLFRLGFAAYLVEAFSDIVLAWLWYVLLKPVNREFALLSAFFGLASMLLFAMTQMFYFAAPGFLSGSDYLAAFSPPQLEALAKALLALSGRLAGLTMLFYGTAWILRGWLSWRSDFLPRALGALMIAAGLGFVAKTVTQLLAPSLSSDLLLAPMFLNVVAMAIWMPWRGVDRGKWERAVAAA